MVLYLTLPFTDPPTSTEYYESETTYIDDTTTAIDEFETTTADPLITPSSTFPMEPIPTTDVYSTEEAIPSITDDISSTVPTPSNSISTTSAVPTTNPETSTNVGAIAGGVVGGVAGVALIGAIVFLLLRRRKAKSAADREVFRPENDEEYAPPAQHSQPSWQNSEAGNYPPMSSAAPPPPRHSYVAPNREAY